MRVKVGDLFDQDVDALVNPANEWLAPGGGLCGQFFTNAGHDELVAACEKIGYCNPGDAVVTRGFRLKQPWIIHAVGPEWRGGDHHEADLLARAYKRSIVTALVFGAKSIAFPAISTGLYGYPKDLAAPIAIKALRDALIDVTVVVTDNESLEAYGAVLA